MAIDLPLIWALILAVGVMMYVLLDGFDLGVGMFTAVVLPMQLMPLPILVRERMERHDARVTRVWDASAAAKPSVGDLSDKIFRF